MASRIDTDQIRREFPALEQKVHGKALCYLDNAATTLKPRAVIDRMSAFYRFEAANVHRGSHFLSDRATGIYEAARQTIAEFIGVKDAEEIIFTRGTTEGVNLLAFSLGETLRAGDEVVLTQMEHHSNMVPWQLLAERRGLKLHFIPVSSHGELDMVAFMGMLSSRTKVVSFVHCSNALGTINPVKEIVAAARGVGALTVLDAAQSISLMPIDVRELGCDFLVYSGHKLFGPFGIGVLWGRKELLNGLPPYQSGGSMIDRVRFDKTTFLSAPHRFEAGTPHVAGSIGLAKAIEFVSEIGLNAIFSHERELSELARRELRLIDGVRLIGEAESRGNIVSFLIAGAHPSDVGQILDQEGVAVRTGHHCTLPLMDLFGIPGTVRASFSIYNNEEDVQRLVAATRKAREFFI
jgi:cysteine desulfurase/selenocysteine lyase